MSTSADTLPQAGPPPTVPINPPIAEQEPAVMSPSPETPTHEAIYRSLQMIQWALGGITAIFLTGLLYHMTQDAHSGSITAHARSLHNKEDIQVIRRAEIVREEEHNIHLRAIRADISALARWVKESN